MSTPANIATVARREYLVRARSRAFVIGTVLLVGLVVAVAFAPALVERLGGSNPTRIAVTATEAGLAQKLTDSMGPLLNGVTDGSAPSGLAGNFAITRGEGVDAARAEVVAGGLDGVLDATRGADGSLTFTFYTSESSTGRTSTLVRQAANAFAIADRLDALGIAPSDRATLFAPAVLTVAWPDPATPGPTKDDGALIGQGALGFGMTILIFMMVIIYGTWIAQSVVEEKSSRVMEVVLNAATPFELLAGKVIGVGGVALTQYGALLVGGIVALVLQDPIGNMILGGGSGSSGLPSGLTPMLLASLAAYGVLGFLLYATLFAAAGSLVSRSEDVNSAVMPLTMLCTLGYIAGTWGSTGLIDLGSGWMVVLTLVPFLSPFMMLGRIAAGTVEPWQVAASLALLAASTVAALWVAARIYAVGVLLYGSWPGWKGAWKLLRQGM
jgi:ABC-2 type transport system permease protein